MNSLLELDAVELKVKQIHVDPRRPAGDKVHLRNADAVEFIAKEDCTLVFTFPKKDGKVGKMVLDADNPLRLDKGPNGPYNVIVDKGFCGCSVEGTEPNPQEIIVP